MVGSYTVLPLLGALGGCIWASSCAAIYGFWAGLFGGLFGAIVGFILGFFQAELNGVLLVRFEDRRIIKVVVVIAYATLQIALCILFLWSTAACLRCRLPLPAGRPTAIHLQNSS